ncbi:nuclear transport factor 2 family protein [Massilia sp. R2A-15]|uniref:nuclear transport factor 2 family protein n=1 Tax=Massilia sp. R2A-15 TaxID=3064278 RepID=UPI002734949C|nr:nuclear transport factor 2 family protein [Massilia sp. R2A-15]WLI89308.1 nuclear transport factor 2 family protein [Massilia sp. R2A-15]
MDTKDTKQLIMSAYQLYKQKDIKGILALCKDDVEWVGPEVESLPFAGNYSGRAAVGDFFTKLDQSMEPLKFEPETFIAEGDKVVVIGSGRWHVKTTGVDYDSPWVHIFTVRDGKIARFEQHTNTAVAEAAFRPIQGAAAAKGAPLRH